MKSTKKEIASLSEQTAINSGIEKIKIENETKHNFIIVYDTIYKNNSLSANEMHLLIKLIGCAPTFEPTITKLASILKMDRATIFRTAKKLQEKGYLKIRKSGNKSKWTINQEPTLNISDFSNDALLNALINGALNESQLHALFKMKYIDDNQYIDIRDKYTRYLIKICKTEWLDKD